MSIVNDSPATVKDASIAFRMLDLRQAYIDRLNVVYALKRVRLDILDIVPRTDEGKEEKDSLLALLDDAFNSINDFYASPVLNDYKAALNRQREILELLDSLEARLSQLHNM